jgi:hypothetical protein
MKIKRDIINEFMRWKNEKHRKPILLTGARQIGKTWAMLEFGKECFDYFALFDFDRHPELKSVFQTSKDPYRIIKDLALYCDVPLLEGKTLLIFDEIQECEEALNSLKYFCEDAPQYHVMAAGSMLGVAVKHRRMTVPVGKVRVMRMQPISFKEFLAVSDEETYSYIETITEPHHLPEIILNKLKLEYRRYLISGGMPEPVVAMLENRGMQEVDAALQQILDLYEMDFAKYADPIEIPRMKAIWHSLPSQLAKENRKFIYNVIRSGARSKDYEDALLWLEDAGMIYRINNISKPGMPLNAYSNPNAFKVYACDCGLLRRLALLPPSAILDNTSNYTEFKGAMAENAVLQSLMTVMGNSTPKYWTSGNKAEVEFVVQWENEIIPIEVKAEGNISGRSLAIYYNKYNPKHRIRFSMLNLQRNEGLLSCPAPLAQWAFRWLQP